MVRFAMNSLAVLAGVMLVTGGWSSNDALAKARKPAKKAATMTLMGTVKAEKDDKGKIKAASLVSADGVETALVLNKKSKALVEAHEGQLVEISGTQKHAKKKGTATASFKVKSYKVVPQKEEPEPEEPELPEEDDESWRDGVDE